MHHNNNYDEVHSIYNRTYAFKELAMLFVLIQKFCHNPNTLASLRDGEAKPSNNLELARSLYNTETTMNTVSDNGKDNISTRWDF